MTHRKKENRGIGIIIGAVLVIILALICILPFVYMMLMAFTNSTTLVFRIQKASLDNLINNLNYIFKNNDFGLAIKNSVIVVIFSCIFNCLISSMAAYGFAKKEFPGKRFLFWIYTITLMVPGQIILIPNFVNIRKMGLMNTYIALIVLVINAFGVILLRQFMKGIPDELIEAAQIDGCSEIKIFARIVLPLTRTALISLVVFTFVSSWNDFLWPLVVTTKSERQTLTVALSLLSGGGVTDTNYGRVMAGAAVTFLVPFVMYCILQKQFVEGIALGSIKG